MKTVLTLVVVAVCAASLHAKPIDIVVAQDGSGQFRNVQDAIMSVPAGTATSPVVIHIRPGTYKELVYIQHEKRTGRHGRLEAIAFS